MYTYKQLTARPTIHSGQYDNLKIETDSFRVWLSRMTVADGMPYNHQVTVEILEDDGWKTIDEYEAV